MLANSPVLAAVLNGTAARATHALNSQIICFGAAESNDESQKWPFFGSCSAENLAEMLTRGTNSRVVQREFFVVNEDAGRPADAEMKLTTEFISAIEKAAQTKLSIPKVPDGALAGIAVAIDLRELCRLAPRPPLFSSNHKPAALRELLTWDRGFHVILRLLDEWELGPLVPTLGLLLGLSDDEALRLIPTGAVSWSTPRADGKPWPDPNLALRYPNKTEAETAQRVLRGILSDDAQEELGTTVLVRDDGVWLFFGPKTGLNSGALGPSQELPAGAVALVAGGMASALGMTLAGRFSGGTGNNGQDMLFLSDDHTSLIARPVPPKNEPPAARTSPSPHPSTSPTLSDSDCSVAIALGATVFMATLRPLAASDFAADPRQTATNALESLEKATSCATPGTPESAAAKAIVAAARFFAETTVIEVEEYRRRARR